MVTDAQIHLWPPESDGRRWAPGANGYAHGPSFAIGDAIRAMDEAGVDQAVLVPPSWEGDRNDYCRQAVLAHPARFVALGRVPTGQALTPLALARWCERNSIVGLRFTFARHASNETAFADSEWVWNAAQAADVPVFLYAPDMTAQVEDLAVRYPDLRITIDHLGLRVGLLDGEITLRIEELVRLAQYPNVSVKAAALPCYVTDPFPFRSLWRPLELVISEFGAGRVFWGSDLTRLRVSYAECVGFVSEIPFLTGPEVELILGGAIRNWLRLS
jgi:L-fuconolactonase